MNSRPDMRKPTIHTKIDQSSLGTADARHMRSRTSDATAQAIVAKASSYPRRSTARTSSRRPGG
jgi:hypothetical protein